MKMLAFTLIIIFSAQLEAAEIYITPGSSQFLSIQEHQNIRIKGREFLAARELGATLKITGKSIGTAQVEIGDTTYKVFIVDKSHFNFLKELQIQLKQMLGPVAEMSDGKPTIKGNIYRIKDWQQISKIAEEFNTPYIMQAKIDTDAKSEALRWIQQRLQNNNLPLPHIVWSPKMVAYVAEDLKNLSTFWQQTLSPLGIEIKYEKSQLAMEPLIRVRIVVAEVNKKLQSQFGIEWPNMITAQIAPKFKGPTSLEVFLKAMEQNGLGQILASPNLLARSGGEADFLAGGEFAIKIINSRMHDVIWKRHGIYLKIKPKADRTGRLSIELSTEVSLIDPSQSVDGIPGLKTNRMATQFDLPSPQTIVLSGLIRDDWGKSENGVFGLSKLPILGSLFKSKEFTSSRSELVIFVTPEIVSEQIDSDKKLLPHGWTQNEVQND
jgi:pilus assembly protein CpaC